MQEEDLGDNTSLNNKQVNSTSSNRKIYQNGQIIQIIQISEDRRINRQEKK